LIAFAFESYLFVIMKIEKLIIPTPFPVGPINIYLVVDDPLTLIDTGPKTPEALGALREQLRALGFKLADIQRIVLTHTHEDHCGLAGTLQTESGARVYVHEWEFNNISEHRSTRVNRGLLARAGVPDAEAESLAARYELVHTYADAVKEVETYRDDQEFVFASGALRVVHTPGHTPGSCCLLRESNRLLIAGDTVLKNITPNPMLNADPLDPRRRFPALGEYLVSLARIRALAPTLIHAAHGPDITDFEEYFFGLTRHIQERQTKIINLVPSTGITAHQLAQQFFPHAKNIHRFLAVSEAVAQLDFAVAEERLKMERGTEADTYFSL
jgi:glyoxylase-like metal-dependent hydrolase (beta-lactamase superfamily II)